MAKNSGVTIIIPSLTYRFINDIQYSVIPNDRIVEFECDPKDLSSTIKRKVKESTNDCIIIINPESGINDDKMINRVRRIYNGRCVLFDSKSELSNNGWLVISKKLFRCPNKIYFNIKDLHKDIILTQKKVVLYHQEAISEPIDNDITPHVDNGIISIIIPFMYNGDRWDLFDATIKRLHEYTKDHDNIEIIVHETAPQRYIIPQYIIDYGLIYLFSEYHGLFHRAWNLNVAARYIARGSTLVFMDADLIIDERWINELLTHDKTKPYIGWGSMKNLDKAGTSKYLKTSRLNGNLERTRRPNTVAAAAGINVIPRNTLFDISGWPESYKDKGYGGEDNSLAHKMMALGIYGNIKDHLFKSPVYHLFHGHQTPRDPNTFRIFQKHKLYNKKDWRNHIKRHSNWGTPLPDSLCVLNKKE